MKVNIADLDRVEKAYGHYKINKTRFLDSLTDRTYNWKTRETTQSLFHVSDNIEGTSFHKNYLGYLREAWANHYGVVLAPDHVWYTLLCEIAAIVKEDPKKYASLFTTSPEEKQLVVVLATDPAVMPMEILFEKLKERVPTDVELFVPEFTTSSHRATISKYVAFADVVSPYYEYATTMCGIPYVDVRGTPEDWTKLANSWLKLSQLIAGHKEFFAKTQVALDRITVDMNKSEFWLDMFRLENCCGSGHASVEGWFRTFFRVIPASLNIDEFASHISGISYKSLETQKQYKMFSGVFSSQLKEDLLEPEFSCAVYEDKSK